MGIIGKLWSVFGPAKKVFDAAKGGYDAGKILDKYTGASDKISKWTFDKFGPASKGLIHKVDKVNKWYNKHIPGETKTLNQNNPAKNNLSVMGAKIYTPRPVPKPTLIKNVSHLPKLTHKKLHLPGLGKSLPFNTHSNSKALKAMHQTKKHFSPINNPMFKMNTIKTHKPAHVPKAFKMK